MVPETDEHSWLDPKLNTIRNYLTYRFPGYTVKEHAFPNLCYMFIVTNKELHRSYGLRVDWARLSEPRNTPERKYATVGEAEAMVNLPESAQEPLTRDLPKKGLQQRRQALQGMLTELQALEGEEAEALTGEDHEDPPDRS